MACHRLTAGFLALTAVAGCRLERIPPGAAVDADAIRGVVVAFHESLTADDYPTFRALFDRDASVVWQGGTPQPVDRFWEDFVAWRTQASFPLVGARAVRLQVRHAGDAGTAWLTSVWTVTRLDEDPKDLEYRAVFLLHRRGERWQVVSLLLQRRTPQSS
jgi:ketosteroid isomerase-like protein